MSIQPAVVNDSGTLAGVWAGINENSRRISMLEATRGSVSGLDGSVIAPGTIPGSSIQNDTITANQIAANTITASEIQAGSITTAALQAGSVTASIISAGAINAGHIQAGSITATQIAANTITAGQIAVGTITATQIQAATITSTQIAAGTITAGNILAGTITATQIATDTITASQIAANAITASELAANSVYANAIQANAVTATSISANSVYAAAIQAGSVDATKINVATLSSISSSMGSITAGTITGATVQTGTSGSRVVIDSLGIRGYALNGTTKVFEIAVGTGIASFTGVANIDPSSVIPGGTITTGTMPGDRIVTGSIQTLQIAAGAITANTIAAGAVTAQKISLVWGGTNKTLNFSAEAPIAGTWRAGTGNWWMNVGSTAIRVTSGAQDGAASVEVTCSGSAAFQGAENYHSDMVYKAGTQYVGSIYAKRTSGATAARMHVGLASVNSADAAITLTNSWQRFSVVWSPSADVPLGTPVYVGVRTSAAAAAVFLLDAVQLEEGELPTPATRRPGEILPGEVGATQITPNSITTNEILAGTILASDIATGTITANEIAASTITASKMNVTTLSAISADMGTITAGTVTGAVIRTAASGARVEISGTSPVGLKKYDASGNVAVAIGQTDGITLLSGTNSTPPNDRKIQWTSSGVVSAELYSYVDPAVSDASLTALWTKKDPTATFATTALITGTAGGYLSTLEARVDTTQSYVLVQAHTAAASLTKTLLRSDSGSGISSDWEFKKYVVSTFPTSPAAGDTIYFQNSAMFAMSPPIMWHLYYDGTKWIHVGGAAVFSEVNPGITTDQSTSSTTYAALTTAGPVLALPVAGVYDIEVSFGGYNASAGGPATFMSYDIGATGAVDADATLHNSAVANTDIQRSTRTARKTFAAASTLTAKYRSPSGGNASFRGPRYIKATPVYIG